MPIYFIRSGNYVKIGRAEEPWRRFAALQTSHYDTLEMLAIMPGDFPVEAEMHRKFKEFRKRGEWFHLSEPILSFIQTLPKVSPLVTRPRGHPPGREYGAQLGLRIRDDQYEHLESASKASNISISDYLRDIVNRDILAHSE
jgi:hypothetical protein